MAAGTVDNGTNSQNIKNRVGDFAQRHGLSFGEAMEMLCRLGLAVCDAVGKEMPREVIASLSSYSPPSSVQPKDNGPASVGQAPASRPPSTDRRSHPRHPASFAAKGKFQNAVNQWQDISGEVTNVSMRGLKLKLDHSPAIDIQAMIKLYLPKMGVETKGKVRHVGRDDDGQTVLDVGVELTNMTREHWLRWLELLAR